MAEPSASSVLGEAGTEVVATSPDEFGRFIANETKGWNKVLSGMSLDKE